MSNQSDQCLTQNQVEDELKGLLVLNKEALLSKLNTSIEGLTADEVSKRTKQYGTNEIVRRPYHRVIFEAISHSTNPLLLILLVAALISAFTGNIVSAIIILTIIVISIGLDYFQSHRALVAMRQLQEKITATTTVIRSGNPLEVPYRELVPGDIIRLVAGDRVPADAILIKSKYLHVQQSALTGESLPVEKEADSLECLPKNIIESSNLVFSGSSIVSGSADAVVVKTAMNTQFGKIAESLIIKAPRAEFEKGINSFGNFIMKTVFVLVVFVFVINIYFHHPLLESLLFAAALAVGLTPELLPMITTVTLAAGAIHLSKEKVIVKNLAAIQNLGSIDILCCDKTGTLTSGEMILEKNIDPFGKKSEEVMLLAYLNSLYITEISNPFNVAILKNKDINPLDAAILKHDHPALTSYHKIDEIPFDFERRRSSVIVENNGARLLITKGAPEHVFNICHYYQENNSVHLLENEKRQQFESIFTRLSSDGYRVLAIANRKLIDKASYGKDDENELVFIGFLAFIDPLLSDIPMVIKSLKNKGVKIKIITGDNELVAKNVCSKAGISAERILMGDELEQLNDSTLAKLAESIDIFARISPMQKQRIISVLKSSDHVVGYLGDGINDAPSLHTADVGISVFGAVDIARESADIILLERHLGVLLNGIIEGRKSFGNVMKYLMMGTSSNFGNMLSMAGAVLVLPFLPMLPTQILLNNLLYDISQITIPTDNVDQSFIKKPKHWNIDIIRKFMFFIGPISSIFDFLTFFVMLKVFHATEPLFQTGWFVESLATQTLVIFSIRTAKSSWKSKPSLALLLTVLFVVCIGILIPFIPLGKFWGFVPLPAGYFLFLVITTLTYLFIIEILKKRVMFHWFQSMT